LANDKGQEVRSGLLEKRSEVGAHILSGAVSKTRALDELFPNGLDLGAPLTTRYTRQYLFANSKNRFD